MTVKFAILDPTTGFYEFAQTAEERNLLLAKRVWATYIAQVHDVPYSVVTVNEDGSETWTAPNGAQIPSPEQIAAEIAAWSAQQP